MRSTIRFRREIYSYLLQSLGKCRKSAVLYIIILLLIAFAEIITPQLYNVFVDEILLQGKTEIFLSVVVKYIILFLISVTATIVSCILLNKIRDTMEYNLRQQAIENFIYPGKENYSDKRIGEIKLRVDNDISTLSDFLQEQFGKYEVKMILMVGAALFLIILNWKLAFVGIVAIPVTLLIDYMISRKEEILNEENRQNDSEMSTWLHYVIEGWRQIKMFGLGKRQERKYVRFQHKYALYNAKWINYWVTRVLIIPKLKNEFLMEFGVYFIGGLLILRGNMTVGQLLVFIVYYHLMTDSMTALSSYQASLQADKTIYLRAMSWKESKVEKKILISSFYQIKWENLTFRYAENLPLILNKLNGRFEIGDCVHIKGKSGNGKTTLLKLMLGLIEPANGTIFVNDQDLLKIDMLNYYKNLSGSLQGVYLFNTSIRENLLYVAPQAIDDELVDACAKAQILKDIHEMPDGFETIVGERGNKLSGGQCQRLLLARAFLKQADIYFFDEITSALDQKTATLVLKEIKNLSKRSIVFLVSHDDIVSKICNKTIDI